MQMLSESALIPLDSLPEAYIRLDSDFRCTFVNLAAQQLLGKAREKLLGTRLWEVYPENPENPLEAGFRRTKAEGTAFTADLYEHTRNRRYAITAVPDEGEDILVRLSDLTDRTSGALTSLA